MRSFANLTRDDGATIAYHRTAGSSPGVVFLGGFGSDMTGTKALYLEDYCRQRGRGYVRFDYFGHGASSGDATLGTVGRWAQDALAVLDSLTEGPQVLVGSSMGGWIMLLTALARPARIHALVGIAAALDFTEDLLWPRLDANQREQLRDTGAVTLPSEYNPQGYTYRLGLFEDGKRHLVMRRAIDLDCPVRLLHGMSDGSVPWQTSLTLAQNLGSRDIVLTLVKDGDHRLSGDADLKRLGRVLDELIESSG
ncbi:MAG: alpha/beta hydrolase [Alphaproteobacteria bacterium]|nr:alpha/beta hydrolase [Alphaproteobacteria bacterium]